MADGYCEPDDVRQALQEQSLSGPTDSSIVEAAIQGVSTWLRRHSGRHWYDSSGAAADTVPTAERSVTNVRRDVPSSPHAQRAQVPRSDRGLRYPVTTDGAFCKVPLDHGYVESITRLAVRNVGGDVDDWVAASDKQQGRDEDYYLQVEGGDSGYGRSVLYVRAASIGARHDYRGLLTVDYDYGLDAQDSDWQDVRRGVANLTAAQLVTDDDVLTSIPNDGQLVGVDTQRDQHVQAAVGEAYSLLAPYL